MSSQDGFPDVDLILKILPSNFSYNWKSSFSGTNLGLDTLNSPCLSRVSEATFRRTLESVMKASVKLECRLFSTEIKRKPTRQKKN